MKRGLTQWEKAGTRFFFQIQLDWRFANRTGKMAPEHKRLLRYPTLSIDEIKGLPVAQLAAPKTHLYLRGPNALLHWGLEVAEAWGFEYKTVITWYKTRKDGGPDGRGVGFYFRNVTELLLFGVKGKNNRTLKPGRTQTNIIVTRKREHSRKPDELYPIIESCSPGPRLELFARFKREGWRHWGNEDVELNAADGVARRNGHVEELVSTPLGLWYTRRLPSWRLLNSLPSLIAGRPMSGADARASHSVLTSASSGS